MPLKHDFSPALRTSSGRSQESMALQEQVLEIPQYWRKFYQRSLQKVLNSSDQFEFTGVNMCSSDEVTRWFRNAFHQVFIRGKVPGNDDELRTKEELDIVLHELGIIKKNALGNWEVNRPGEIIAESSALRSVPDVMNVLEEWIREPSESKEVREESTSKPKKLLYLERGPGDGRNVDWLRTQCPNWEYRSIGHVLFFSVTSLLHGFLRPELKSDPHVMMFLRILSIFLVRELNAQDSKDPGINTIFPLLAKMGDWIRKYCDKANGFYVDSNEFEFDTLKKLEEISPFVASFFREFNWFITAIHFRFDEGVSEEDTSDARLENIKQNKEVFLSIFQKTFQSDFCNEIARHLFEDKISSENAPLDLRKCLPVYPTGFTQGYFTDIPDLLEEGERIAFSSDVRASSHESNEDFHKDLDGFLNYLEQGGALSLDGGRESYVRDDRSDIVQAIIRAKNAALGREEFRFYAMVEHGSPPGTRARAMWIERAKGGRFMPPDKLVRCFNTEKFEILMGDEYADRFMIRLESEVRRIFKRVFIEKFEDLDRVKQQFGNDEVKKTIDFWIQHISHPSRRPSSLSAEQVIKIFEDDIRIQAIACSYDDPQVKEIPSIYALSFDTFVSPVLPPKKASLRQIVR